MFDVSGTLEQFDVAALKRFSVIATPLTEHGHHLLRRGGAALLAAGSSRKDGCSVYGREITHGYHSRVLPAVEHLVNGSVGFKVNPISTLLISFNVIFQMNDAGLRSRVVPLVGFSYSF